MDVGMTVCKGQATGGSTYLVSVVVSSLELLTDPHCGRVQPKIGSLQVHNKIGDFLMGIFI